MGKTRFVPLTLGLIEEGQYAEEADNLFQHLQRQMIEYVHRYGTELATGAKGKLALTITIEFQGRNERDFSIRGEMRATLPARPPIVSRATAGETDDGDKALFVRPTGSSALPPQQGKLVTRSGDVIDTKTGELVKTATG